MEAVNEIKEHIKIYTDAKVEAENEDKAKQEARSRMRLLAKQIGLDIRTLEQEELEALMKAIEKSELYRQKKGNKLYVRIDKVGEKEMTQQDFQDHFTYVKNIAKERFFLGGGFSNIDGGMILCEADNFDEAQKIFHDDPIIKKELYHCDVFEWDLVVLSGDNNNQ